MRRTVVHMNTASLLPSALDQLVADRIASIHADAAAVRAGRQARARRPWRRRTTRTSSGPAAEPVFHPDISYRGRPPTVGTADFARWSDLLATHVAEHGIASAERAVAAIVRTAHRRGATTPALEVLGGRDEPVAARERALGLVLGELARSARRAERAGESSAA